MTAYNIVIDKKLGLTKPYNSPDSCPGASAISLHFQMKLPNSPYHLLCNNLSTSKTVMADNRPTLQCIKMLVWYDNAAEYGTENGWRVLIDWGIDWPF